MRAPWLTLPVTVALALAGCAGMAQPDSDPETRLDEPALVGFSASKPPSVVAVETTRTGGRGVVQRITFENRTSIANENRIEVQLDLNLNTLSDTLGLEPAVSVVKPLDRLDIRTFLANEFPGIRMVASETLPTNRYGHFAYATSTGQHGETCILAWQIVSDQAPELPRNLHRMGLLFRFCDPVRSGRALLALFETITLGRWPSG